MVKVKYILIFAAINFALFINAGFIISGKSSGSITVKFTPEKDSRGMAVILPPDCRFTVSSNNGSGALVYSPAVYYKDFYLLPLKSLPYSYTAVINFSSSSLKGKVVKPDSSVLALLKRNTINYEDALKYIKPRSLSASKSGYDGTPLVKIIVDHDGMYRLTASEILSLRNRPLFIRSVKNKTVQYGL